MQLKQTTGQQAMSTLRRIEWTHSAGFRVGGAHEGSAKEAAAAGLRHDASKVLLDPYATSVVSRDRWGERGSEKLDYSSDDVLGLADTWPQAASPVPDPDARPFDWEARPCACVTTAWRWQDATTLVVFGGQPACSNACGVFI
jgi:pullulanase/glycogen debranching enzyme